MSAAQDSGAVGTGSPQPCGLAVAGFDGGELEFLASEQPEEVTLERASDCGKPVVVLYRAPWIAFLQGHRDGGRDAAERWLADWIRFYSDALQLQHRFPDRVLLVNAGHAEIGAPLRQHLRDLGWTGALPEAEGADDGGAAPDPGTGARALQSLLAAAMANACPEAWATYEELESRALLFGREPEFRGADGIADLADPGELLTGFAALRDAISREVDAARPVTPAVDPEAEALRRENELLGLHLEQVLEELQFHCENGKQMRRQLLEAGEISEAARLLISDLGNREQAPG